MNARVKIIPVFLLAVLVGLPACAEAPGAGAASAGRGAGPLPDTLEVRIVVLGSSTAEGVGPEEAANAWVNRFRAYAKRLDASFEVVNLARGGYTTYHLLPSGSAPPEGRPSPDTLRNITRALALRPAAIIINLPSNDTAGGYSIAEQLANYDVILAGARAAGVPVWVTTTQPRNLEEAARRAQQALRDSTLARYGDHAVDFWTGLARDDGTIDPAYDSGDHIHLNDEAHRLLFERMRDAGVLEAVTPASAPLRGH